MSLFPLRAKPRGRGACCKSTWLLNRWYRGDGWRRMAARLSAFADEIGADPHLQVKVLQTVGIRYVELRGAWGVNVLKLSDSQIAELQRLFADNGIAVSCI